MTDWERSRKALVALAFWAAAQPLLAPVVLAETSADAPTVTFFLQGVDRANEEPWTTSLRTMGEAAAEDLGLNLDLVYTGEGREDARIAMQKRVETADPPDYAMIINYRGLAVEMMSYLGGYEVETFLFNSGLTDAEYRSLGDPGDVLPNWIGVMTPDDEKAGYDLAKALITTAKAEKSTGPIKILGLTGSYANPIAHARVQGLERACREDPRADLVQIVSARWARNVAGEKFGHLLNRYPDVDVVWTASDEMAMGIVDHPRRPAGLKIGGMDWIPEAREAVARGDMAVTIGGHTIDVAYVMAAIAVYAERKASGQAAPLAPLRNAKSRLIPLTRDTMKRHAPILDTEGLHAFDFSLLTSAISGTEVAPVSIDAFIDLQKANGHNR